jgi:hypothetical protein
MRSTPRRTTTFPATSINSANSSGNHTALASLPPAEYPVKDGTWLGRPPPCLPFLPAMLAEDRKRSGWSVEQAAQFNGI